MFNRLKSADLAKAAIRPQVFDDQWVPRKLLPRMIEEKRSLADARKERSELILKEWCRAFVYDEQVVVNRAYLFNNEVVVSDYAKDNRSRSDFNVLLNDQVIVPFLATASSPDDRPKFDIKDDLDEGHRRDEAVACATRLGRAGRRFQSDGVSVPQLHPTAEQAGASSPSGDSSQCSSGRVPRLSRRCRSICVRRRCERDEK